MSAKTLDRLAELMEARFQQMDGRFGQMDARFGQMDTRFERLEHRTEAVEHGVVDLRVEMLERFHQVNLRIDRLSDEMRERFRV